MDTQLKMFVDSLEKWFTAEDIVHSLEGCVSCGLCGQACAWYLETGDPQQHPKNRSDFVRTVYKRYNTLQGRILGTLGLMPSPTVEDLKAQMKNYWSCTVCGRCTIACPLGVSNRRLYRVFRMAYTDAGFSDEHPTLAAIIKNSRDAKHSFGLSREEVLGKPGMFMGNEDCEMPLDVPGAKYLFVCPAAGNTKIPELGIKGMKILNAAGIDYTVSAKVIDTGTEIDHVAGHHELSKKMLLDWEAEADRLGCQAVIVAECGCDVRTMYVESTEVLGRPFRYPVISVDSIFAEIIDKSMVPLEPVDTSVTFHDPCYVTRLSGMADKYRHLLPKVTNDFRDMAPHLEQNYCCNGGAGGMRMPENTEMRRKASRLKATQIESTKADVVATPCAICYLNMKDTTEYYKQATPEKRKARMFFEIVYDAMMKGLRKTGEVDRIKIPASIKNMSPEDFKKHSISGYMEDLKKRPVFKDLLEKFRSDPNVNNYAMENPGFWEYFDRVEAEVNGVEPVTANVSK